MRCALVIPAWKPEEIFPSRTAGSQINYWQPLGTLYVAAGLRSAGQDVRFLNGAFQTHEEILADLISYRPELVGLYSTTFGWPKALRTAAAIRHLLPATYIVVGGPYPSAVGAACLGAADDINAVVVGEGEIALAQVATRLEGGDGLQGIAGVVFREGGRVVANPPRPLLEDLDSLPLPARDLLGDSYRYLPPPATYRRTPVAVMITSRGCNRRCIFCFQMDRERTTGVRFRGVDRVLDEIEECLRLGYREIKFLDDTLAADRERAMELARKIRERRLDFTWFASACVNQVDRPLLEAFRAAGCWAVLFGAESGVQKNLNTLRKGITLEQTRRAVRAAKGAGLTVQTPFLIGIPGETPAEARETIRFACEVDPDIASFHAITPFPGTELYEHRERFGTVSEDLGDYTYQGSAFVPHTMTREEISTLRQEAYRRFYGRPRYLLRRLSRVRTLNDLRAACRGGRSLFWLAAGRGVFRRWK